MMLRPGEALGSLGRRLRGNRRWRACWSGYGCPRREKSVSTASIFPQVRSDLGPHIGYVPQDVELLAGTVARTLRVMGRQATNKSLPRRKPPMPTISLFVSPRIR